MMNEDPSREWSPEERRALESLQRDEPSSPHLERRVVAALGRGGLLAGGDRPRPSRSGSPARVSRGRPGRPSASRWLAAAAIFVAGIASGALLFRLAAPAPEAGVARASTDPRFILLLYEDEGYRRPPAGREAERNAEYGAWIGGLAGDGRWVGGAELAPTGTLLTPAGVDGAEPVSRTGAPATEAGELTGYFLFEASGVEEATRIAATCPHLRYGGVVSLRRLRE